MKQLLCQISTKENLIQHLFSEPESSLGSLDPVLKLLIGTDLINVLHLGIDEPSACKHRAYTWDFVDCRASPSISLFWFL